MLPLLALDGAMKVPGVHSNSSAKTKPAQAGRRILYLQTGMGFYRYMITAKSAALLPLWVISGHEDSDLQSLCPRKRTWMSTAVMSALCQKQTLCGATSQSLFDHLIGQSEQAYRGSEFQEFSRLEINDEVKVG